MLVSVALTPNRHSAAQTGHPGRSTNSLLPIYNTGKLLHRSGAPYTAEEVAQSLLDTLASDYERCQLLLDRCVLGGVGWQGVPVAVAGRRGRGWGPCDSSAPCCDPPRLSIH